MQKVNFKRMVFEMLALLLVGLGLLVAGKLIANKTLFLIGSVSSALFLACVIAAVVLYVKDRRLR